MKTNNQSVAKKCSMSPNHTQSTGDQGYWIAIQTFHAQEKKVCGILDSYQTKHFVPMVTRTVVTKDGKRETKLQPAVHNLIFLQVDRSIDEIKRILADCPYSISVYSQMDKPGVWCMIPDKDMVDLRLICDITFTTPVFASAKEIELKVGSLVRVTHGPMKGISGKLVRKNKKYYLVKTFAGMGVMVNVSRWCCERIESEK